MAEAPSPGPTPLAHVRAPFLSYPSTRRYPPRRADRVIIIQAPDEVGLPTTNTLFWFAGLLFIVNMLIKIGRD